MSDETKCEADSTEIPTKDLMRNERQREYRAAKAARAAERKQEKADKQSAKAEERKKRDAELWESLSSGTRIKAPDAEK